MKKKRLLWIIPSAILTILIILYFLFPVFAKVAIQKRIARFETEQNAELSIDGLHIGLMSLRGKVPVSFTSMQLRGQNASDTLLNIHQLKATLQIIKGFHLTDDLISLDCDTFALHLIHSSPYKNYNFLLKKKKGDAKPSGHDYKKLSQDIIQTIGNILPQIMRTGSLSITADIHGQRFCYTLPDFAIENGKMHGFLTEQYGFDTHSWFVEGMLDHDANSYSATLRAQEGSEGFAIFNELKEAKFSFHEFTGCLSSIGSDATCAHYSLRTEARGLILNHHYLATDDIIIDSAAAELDLAVSPTRITIDSTSLLKLNNAELHPFFAYEKHDTAKPHITLIINEKGKNAENLIGSLPDGLFQVIPELNISGNMDFGMLFDCDFSEVDSLDFDFHIGSHDHTIHINGDTSMISRFNHPFDYVFFENGDTSRIVAIGPSNPYFCPYSQIPPYLTKSILATEDAGFFYHRGFIKSSIRDALVADIKAGKLRRGGSTMTMQLVKNLFLNRKKVFSRKFEEMVLVWLIEDYRLISKERMFEIYVNIAEWGPGIIGIGEASEFYFAKQPQDLTLGECIYLASLIRAPKHYRNTLDKFGNVIDSKREELIFVARRMVEREFITEEELSHFNSFIQTKCMDSDED